MTSFYLTEVSFVTGPIVRRGCKKTVIIGAGSPLMVTRPETVAVPTLTSFDWACVENSIGRLQMRVKANVVNQ